MLLVVVRGPRVVLQLHVVEHPHQRDLLVGQVGLHEHDQQCQQQQAQDALPDQQTVVDHALPWRMTRQDNAKGYECNDYEDDEGERFVAPVLPDFVAEICATVVRVLVVLESDLLLALGAPDLRQIQLVLHRQQPLADVPQQADLMVAHPARAWAHQPRPTSEANAARTRQIFFGVVDH